MPLAGAGPLGKDRSGALVRGDPRHHDALTSDAELSRRLPDLRRRRPPLVLGLILIALAALAAEHWRLAAGCVAVAVLFKLYPAAILLLAVTIFPRRFAGWSLVALVTGLLLPFLMQSPSYVASQYQAWWHHLGDYDRRGASTEYWYRDLRLLAEVCGWHMSDRLYAGIQLLAA